MSRVHVELGRAATVLDAAERIAAAPPDAEIVLAVAAGAPFLRNAVFLRAARAAAGLRRLVLVTGDARARALASAAHITAFASLGALERGELDATEPLGGPTRTVPRAPVSRPEGGRRPPRSALITGGMTLAALVLLAALGPEAVVVVAPQTTTLGPVDVDLRAGPGGDVPAQALTANVSAKVTGSASGSRIEDSKAAGTARLTNRTSSDIRIARATTFRTTNGLAFITVEEKVLPHSVINILPPSVTLGTVDVRIEAIDPGPQGNVGANAITVSPDPNAYTVANPSATAGGDSRKIPIVRAADYDAAVAKLDAALKASADTQMAAWRAKPPQNLVMAGDATAKVTSQTQAAEVVGKEIATFELSVSGAATGFAISTDQPRASVLAKLQGAATAGNDVLANAASIDLGQPATAADGVRWHVRASAPQFPHIERGRVASAIAGRPPAEAPGALAAIGLRVVRVTWTPGWWPRLPFLDWRIRVDEELPAAAAGR